MYIQVMEGQQCYEKNIIIDNIIVDYHLQTSHIAQLMYLN